jgi:hypothetical protein
MTICRHCEKSFHCCLSCGLIGYENYYCSKVCWNNSHDKKILDKFIESLSNEQLYRLKFLLNQDLLDDLITNIDIKTSLFKQL